MLYQVPGRSAEGLQVVLVSSQMFWRDHGDDQCPNKRRCRYINFIHGKLKRMRKKTYESVVGKWQWMVLIQRITQN